MKILGIITGLFLLLLYSEMNSAAICRQNNRIPSPRKDTVYSYSIHVNRVNNRYYCGISVAMYTGVTIADGELSEFDSRELFFGYDSSVIEFKGNELIPRSVGKTCIYLRHPDKPETVADSLVIQVRRLYKRFIIEAISGSR
jgi:hypothetical protein